MPGTLGELAAAGTIDRGWAEALQPVEGQIAAMG